MARRLRESEIERYLVEKVKSFGGVAEKFSSPARRFVPDRLVTFPCGVIAFIEVKALKKKPTLGQINDHKKRRAMGLLVFVVDDLKSVDAAVSALYALSIGAA